MAEPKYVYALCRDYDPKQLGIEDEREIRVGIERGLIDVQLCDLFKTKRGEYVARFEEVSRSRGCVIGKINDSFNKWRAMRTIPIDDLVDPSEIVSSVR